MSTPDVRASAFAGPKIASRAASLELVASHETAKLVRELRADGHDVLSLYGSPHWLPPEHVLDAARAAITDNDGAPASGLPALLEAMAARLQRENGITVAPDREIAVTNAANHALSVLLTTVLDAGDEVLTFSPHYYYQGIISLAGGVPTYAETTQQNGWRWDHDALRAAVTDRTKVLIVNTPTNPSGYVATEDDLRAIAALAEERNLLIVSDEAYDHTVYDGRRHLSIAALPQARARTVTVISMTKSYAMRHWRVGFLVGPAELMHACRNVLEWNVFNCNNVFQHAVLAALTGPQEWIGEISARFERCRDVMTAALAGTPGLSFAVPSGGPFLFVRVEGLGVDAEAFRYILLRDHGVPTDPGRYFGSAAHLRLPFGGELDDVAEAARRIRAAAEAASAHGAAGG